MTISNQINAELLRSFVERLERLAAEKKDLSEAEKLVKQEAKSAGYDVERISDILKIRRMKPHDLQEAEALLDMYRHAMGMDTEPPLFRYAGLAGIDITARDQVIASMKQFVPAHGKGEITVTWGGKAIRLTRGLDGEVTESEPPQATAFEPRDAKDYANRAPSKAPRAEVPDVDADGAFDLGVAAARDNQPVISNPFPYADARRPKWDAGWRKGAGNDGMGGDDQ